MMFEISAAVRCFPIIIHEREEDKASGFPHKKYPIIFYLRAIAIQLYIPSRSVM